MSYRYSPFFFILGMLLLYACSTSNNETQEESNSDSKSENAQLSKGQSISLVEIEKNGLKLSTLPEASEFPDATLKLITSTSNLKAGEQKLEFELDDFDLAEPTKDDRAPLLANSKKGQHIHFIHNNGPYQAEYEEDFKVELSEGHNVILAFLSRSYHESVKEAGAFVFKDILIGESFIPFEITEPHLIYSRPRGTYSLSGSNRILIDFFLLNAELSAKGMNVELSINETVFMLDSWQAYWVEGLGIGEHRFRIRLLNSEGELVYGPFNDSGVRTIRIEE